MSFNNLTEKYFKIIQHGHTLFFTSGNNGIIYHRNIGHLITFEE